MGLLNLVN